jgi:hypothetical protein
MFLHGKHFFTESGLNLDEVKSLLQKSLRRKEVYLAYTAAKELGHIVSWDKLLTYVFEDHSLISSRLLTQVLDSYILSKKEKTDKTLDTHKKNVIDLLLSKCKTSRVAACLPVVAIDEEYRLALREAFEVEQETFVFVYELDNCINVNRVISCLRREWKQRDCKRIISLMKLVTASHDLENRKLTKEGKDFIRKTSKLGNKCQEGIGQLVLALLFSDTHNSELSSFLHTSLHISLRVPKAPMRLILFSVVAHMIFLDNIMKATEEDIKCLVNWESVGKIKEMPMWATDKHTFRGKFGKSTQMEVIKKGFSYMPEDMLNEFHGPRPKCDLTHFFTEGVKEVSPMLVQNPYWEKTKNIYLSFPQNKQKTLLMTKDYVFFLQNKMPDIFHDINIVPKKKQTTLTSYFSSQANTVLLNRKRKCEDSKETVTKKKCNIVEDTYLSKFSDINQSLSRHLPLLQVPCGAHKCYTRVDIANKIVLKGPMQPSQVRRISAIYTMMRTIFEDIHTVPLIEAGNYLVFPLLTGKNACLSVEQKTIKDCKQGGRLVKTDFMNISSLGLCQLHNLMEKEIYSMPLSLWMHFMFRFIIKVGDSGLYNALTDVERTFVFGIDLDETRSSNLPENLLDILFTRRPRKVLCDQIRKKLKQHKLELIQNVSNIEVESTKMSDLLVCMPNINIDEVKKRKCHIVNTLHRL